jgi:hypothetical protein
MSDLDELELAMPHTTKEVSEDGRTTPHSDGYPAVLMRIPDLALVDREELYELVVEAWLTRAQKRVAKAWLEEHQLEDD